MQACLLEIRGPSNRPRERAMVFCKKPQPLVLMLVLACLRGCHVLRVAIPAESYDRVAKAANPPQCDAVWRWVNPSSLVSRGRLNHNRQRFRDNGELRYSMRAFADVFGINNFHVVARGSPPAWLDTSHTRIRWWDEQERIRAFLEERNLSSHKHRLLSANSEPSKIAVAALAGHLAERFLLLDDDYFVVPQPSGSPPLNTSMFFECATRY